MAKNDNKIVAIPQQEKPKLQTMYITFSAYALGDDQHEQETREFTDIIGHQIGQNWVAVVKEKENIVFPAAGIISIRVVNAE